jgi:hypothetical protein
VSTGGSFLRIKRLETYISLVKEEMKDMKGQEEAVG